MPAPASFPGRLRARLGRLALVALIASQVLILTGVRAASSSSGPPPHVGFSYTPGDALTANVAPVEGLTTLLDALHPDIVRLPVYWTVTEPEPGAYTFVDVDAEFAAIAAWQTVGHHRHVSVVLVVGVRNLGYPEVFVPQWLQAGPAQNAPAAVATPQYRAYIAAVVEHFRGSPLLAAWQIENEPLDNVGDVFDGSTPALNAADVATAVSLVDGLDSSHPLLVTTYDSATLDLDVRAMNDQPTLWPRQSRVLPAGSPSEALGLGDVLGLDAYVLTDDGQAQSVAVAERIGWKANELAYWAQEARVAGKALWVPEMQAEPFAGTSAFTTDDLVAEATAYRSAGADVVMLWGAGTWLSHPAWLQAAHRALSLLRH